MFSKRGRHNADSLRSSRFPFIKMIRSIEFSQKKHRLLVFNKHCRLDSANISRLRLQRANLNCREIPCLRGVRGGLVDCFYGIKIDSNLFISYGTS